MKHKSLVKPGFFSLVIFLFTFFTGHCSQHDAKTPCIIYLKGTCSSGKSTFIRQFINQHKNVVVVDEDAIMHRSYVDAVAKRFPTEFAIISSAIARENLYHALREKDVLFKKTTPLEECAKAVAILAVIQEELDKPQNLAWKQGISSGIDAEVLKKIHQAQEQDKTVLLDSWYIKPRHLHEHFPKSKIIRVMLYCPLQVTYERFLKRNNEAMAQGDLQEKRYLRQLVGSFFSLYQISTQPAQPIVQVYKKELDQFIDAIACTLKDQGAAYEKPIFTFSEVSKDLFLKMKTEFLLPFEAGDSGASVLYISPKEEQDVIIDNSKDDLQKAILLIKKLLGDQTLDS